MKQLYSKVCTICNKTFSFFAYPYSEAFRPRKVCSPTCQYVSVSNKLKNKITRNCKYCKNSYITTPSLKKSFCSLSCQIKHMKSQTGDKNPAWKPINERASYRTLKTTLRRRLISSTTVCAVCNNASDCFEIHHIDKNRNNNELTNLMVLCLDCHADKHKGERAEKLIRGSKNHSHNVARPKKACEQCQELFSPYYDAHRFCSKKCSKKFIDSKTPSKLVSSKCPYCNKEYLHKPSQIRKFCSRECHQASRKLTQL